MLHCSKDTSVFSHCPVLQLCSSGPPLLNTQSPLIGQLTHAWPSSTYKNREGVLNHFRHAKLAPRHKLGKCSALWHSVTSQSHRIKGGATDEAFQEQCFLWERGASIWTFVLSRSITCKWTNTNVDEKGKTKKHNRSPLMMVLLS